MNPALSVVIPAWNDAPVIGRTLDALHRLATDLEIIVADGGSSDDTTGIAQWCGARVLSGPRGRGLQMHAGACAAQATIVWFLHADTLAPLDACEHILAALADHTVAGGSFHVRCERSGFAAPLLSRLAGEPGLFLRRSVYERAGGFRPNVWFEQRDLLRRVRPYGSLRRVPATLITPSFRFPESRRLPLLPRVRERYDK